MGRTGRWNDVSVTKIGKVRFSDRLTKHIIRELPSHVLYVLAKIHSVTKQMLREGTGAVVTSVTFLFLFAYQQDNTSNK